MITQELLDEMRSMDIRAVRKDALADMSGFHFDNSIPQPERAKRIFEAAKNPYLFRHGDMAVKIEFAENGPPLQDMMAALLLRQKNGL